MTTARENDKIAIPQYTEGELSFDTGVVNEIKEKELYYYSYYSVGAAGSSGSPIVQWVLQWYKAVLQWDFRAIGMHKQSGTCIEHKALGPIRRATATPVQLLSSSSSASHLQLIRRVPNQTLRNGEKDPKIYGISYNSASDELFVADYNNKIVRAMLLRDDAGDLRDVYRATHTTCYHICHICECGVCAT